MGEGVDLNTNSLLFSRLAHQPASCITAFPMAAAEGTKCRSTTRLHPRVIGRKAHSLKRRSAARAISLNALSSAALLPQSIATRQTTTPRPTRSRQRIQSAHRSKSKVSDRSWNRHSPTVENAMPATLQPVTQLSTRACLQAIIRCLRRANGPL